MKQAATHPIRRFSRALHAEHGSTVAQAAGIAMAAILLIGAILWSSQQLAPAAGRSFSCLAAVLGGGGGSCSSGDAATQAPSNDTARAPEQDDGGSWWETGLDWVQGGLDVVGLIPGAGEIADGINGVISLARGDYVGAGLSFAAMVPFAGWAATGGKWVRRGINYSDEAAAVVRNSDEAAAIARQAEDIPFPCRGSAVPSGKAPGLGAPLWAGPCMVGQPGGYRNRADFDNNTRGLFSSPDKADSGWLEYQKLLNSTDTPVIGRLPDTDVAKDWPGHTVLNSPNWNVEVNDAWVQGGIDRRAPFYLGTPQNATTLTHPQYGQSVFAREIAQLEAAGYRKVGDYMLPPP